MQFQLDDLMLRYIVFDNWWYLHYIDINSSFREEHEYMWLCDSKRFRKMFLESCRSERSVSDCCIPRFCWNRLSCWLSKEISTQALYIL